MTNPTDWLQPWMASAACAQVDPDLHHPEKGEPNAVPKRVCMGCEVRTDCLEYALARDERSGIWGGLSTKERDRVRRSRGSVAA